MKQNITSTLFYLLVSLSSSSISASLTTTDHGMALLPKPLEKSTQLLGEEERESKVAKKLQSCKEITLSITAQWECNRYLLKASQEGVLKDVETLLNVGARTNARDSNGKTPLHNAAQNGHEAIIKLLLEKGADKEARGEYGRTPLHYAAANSHSRAITILIKAGACKDALDINGKRPFDLVKEPDIAVLLK